MYFFLFAILIRLGAKRVHPLRRILLDEHPDHSLSKLERVAPCLTGAIDPSLRCFDRPLEDLVDVVTGAPGRCLANWKQPPQA